MKYKNLKSARNKIDQIDEKIMHLLLQRFRVLSDIKEIKNKKNISMFDERRRDALLAKAKEIQKGHLAPVEAYESYKDILRKSLKFLRVQAK